jgi:hypothetical protein
MEDDDMIDKVGEGSRQSLAVVKNHIRWVEKELVCL